MFLRRFQEPFIEVWAGPIDRPSDCSSVRRITRLLKFRTEGPCPGVGRKARSKELVESFQSPLAEAPEDRPPESRRGRGPEGLSLSAKRLGPARPAGLLRPRRGPGLQSSWILTFYFTVHCCFAGVSLGQQLEAAPAGSLQTARRGARRGSGRASSCKLDDLDLGPSD